MKALCRWTLAGTLAVTLGATNSFGTPVQWRVEDGGNGHYYERITNPVSWQTAKVAAEAMSYKGLRGHLVTITSAAEDEFLKANIQLAGQVTDSWIGLTDSEAYGGYESFGQPNPAVDGWVWVTGEPVAYTRWYPGTPNNFQGDADGVTVSTHYDPYHWIDRPMAWMNYYIVEYDQLLEVNISIASVDISWLSASNTSYQVQWSTNLVQSSWSNLGGVVIGTGSNMYVNDIIRSLPHRFYRVVLP